jgi:hypothetical protein
MKINILHHNDDNHRFKERMKYAENIRKLCLNRLAFSKVLPVRSD